MNKLVIVDNEERHNKSFNDPVEAAVAAAELKYERVNYRDVTPELLKNIGGLVVAGVEKNSAVDTKKRLEMIDYVFDAGVPEVDICFGHQLRGLHAGAALILDRQQEEDGIIKIRRAKGVPTSLFDGLPPEFDVRTMHTDAVELPRDYTLLAGTVKCPNQAMADPSGLAETVQFHIERSPDPRITEAYFGNFAKKVSDFHQALRDGRIAA